MFAFGEISKIPWECANRFKASAFTFHGLGLRWYNGTIPRYLYLPKRDFSLSFWTKSMHICRHLAKSILGFWKITKSCSRKDLLV